MNAMLNLKQKLSFLGIGAGVLGAFIATQIVGAHFGYDPRLGGATIPLPSPPFGRIAVYHPLQMYGWIMAADFWPQALLTGFIATSLCILTAMSGLATIIHDMLTGSFGTRTFGSFAWGTKQDAVKAGLISVKGSAKEHMENPLTFVLGEAFGTTLTVTDDRFIGIFLPTRGGKSRLLSISLLSWKSSAFIYLAGATNDIWAYTSGYRATFSDVVLLDLGNPIGWHYNPLIEIRKGTHYEWDDCRLIANRLPLQTAKEARVPYWITAPTKLIAAIIRYVIHMAPKDQRTLSTVRDLAALGHSALARILATSPHKNVQETAENIKKSDSVDMQRVLNAALDYLSPWESEVIRNVTSRSDFSMSDLMSNERPMSLYVRVPDSMANEWSQIVKIIFAQTRKAILHHEDEMPDGRTKINELAFILDEFASIDDSELENDIAKMAKYGARLILATQSPRTLEEHGSSTIRQNLTVQIYGASGDPQTLAELERSLGDVTEVRESRSSNADYLSLLPKSRVAIHSEHVRNLLNSGQIRSLSPDEVLILPTGYKPFRAKKLINFTEREPWKSMIMPPAPMSPLSVGSSVAVPGAFI